MAVKYILVGGYPHKAADGGKALCEEMVRGFAEPVKILVCEFARPRETWEMSFAQDERFFHGNLPGKRIEMVLAQPEKFIRQVRWADVIYLRGGKTEVLQDLLAHSGDWKKELEGKTLVGSSAGAEVIVMYGHYLTYPNVWHGLGMVPIKVISHWQAAHTTPNVSWDEVFSMLKKYKEDLPIVTLKEGEFYVVSNEYSRT